MTASLTPEFAVEIRDLLIQLPTDNPYNTLKTELIRHTAILEQHKLQQLTSMGIKEDGDRKSTQLYSVRDHLGIGADNNEFLKELFLQRAIPCSKHACNYHIIMVLTSADPATDLAKLWKRPIAKIVEVATFAESDSSLEVR